MTEQEYQELKQKEERLKSKIARKEHAEMERGGEIMQALVVFGMVFMWIAFAADLVRYRNLYSSLPLFCWGCVIGMMGRGICLITGGIAAHMRDVRQVKEDLSKITKRIDRT